MKNIAEGPIAPVTMNNFRNVYARVSATIPKATPGGSAPGGGSIAFLAILGLAGYGTYHSVVTVQPGHKGVVYNRFGGLSEKADLKEGLNFVVPWFQRPIVFDLRTRPQPIDTTSGSKGGCTTASIDYIVLV